jgi:hypothetical protein
MTATFCRITSCERWEVSIDFNARCAGFNLISGTLVGLELEEEEEMVEEACPKDLESDLPSFLYIVVLVLVVSLLFKCQGKRGLCRKSWRLGRSANQRRKHTKQNQ